MNIYAVSDIHGFYDEFKKALNRSGFKPNDSNDLLVVCGDIFDRGSKNIECMQYLNSLNNVVLVMGNHERLLVDMLTRGYPLSHDKHNHTIETAYDLILYYGLQDLTLDKAYAKVLSILNKTWLNKFVNYYETNNYVFVHGYIPEDKDWRNGNWSEAAWLCGIEQHLFTSLSNNRKRLKNKTVVCGHWHCSYAHYLTEGTPEFGPGANFDPYIGKGIICIDACTASTHKVNIVKLKDERLN